MLTYKNNPILAAMRIAFENGPDYNQAEELINQGNTLADDGWNENSVILIAQMITNDHPEVLDRYPGIDTSFRDTPIKVTRHVINVTTGEEFTYEHIR